MTLSEKDREILIENYLQELRFLPEEIESSLKDKIFIYSPIKDDDIFSEKYKIIYFFYRDKNELYEQHKDFWNENKIPVFIAVNDQNSFIIDVKQKPDRENPTRSRIGRSFDYGTNSIGFEEKKIEPLLKEKIDNSYFWNYVIERRKKVNEVDDDLLKNLVALHNELTRESKNYEEINLLILQCLFVKYLEDRDIFGKESILVNALKQNNDKELIKVFERIKSINGDIFSNIEFTVTSEQLRELAIFFEHDYSEFKDKKQPSIIFPYKFDKIPIELISNVYEEFLGETDKDKKKSQGIFYTRSFVVDFMLSHTVYEQVKNNKKITVLDPACGSGIFLVQSYKAIIEAYRKDNEDVTIDEKLDILLNQIFGIDIDKQALQIAAFSLYLALLSTCTKEEIAERIKKQKPMLPSMYGKNLQKKNTITDEITFSNENQNFESFDCIVGNPPWGSIDPFNYLLTEKSLTKLKEEKVPENVIYCLNELISNSIKSNHIDKELNKILGKEDKKYKSVIKESAEIDDIELSKERQCITNKSNKLYSNVSDKQRSQCFLFRINQWCNKNTTISFIVNNSDFLNENAEDFRKEILKKYNITKYYDLSNISSILFTGSKEPASVLIMDKKKNSKNILEYHSAQLTDMAKLLNLIHCSSNDIKEIKQADLLEEGQDVIWKIFVNGNWDDYQLLKKKYINRDLELIVECRSGFQPRKGMVNLGKPSYKKIIEPNDFENFHIINKLEEYNWNQNFRRKPDLNIFREERILIPLSPTEVDNNKIRGIFVKEEIIHKHNILSVKLKENYKYIKNLNAVLGILNSKFIGYYLNYISSQWKEGKRNTLRNSDIENLPFPKIDKNNPKVIKLINFVEQIQIAKKENLPTKTQEDQIDELVFDLYGLLDFEKEIIREYYDVNVYRKGDTIKDSEPNDFQKYVDKFRKVFSFILDDGLALNAEYSFQNIGASVCFSIVKKEDFKQDAFKNSSKITKIVKKKQLKKSLLSKAIKEEKIKIYTPDNFTIIKSKYFKDWTVRQAMKDANEEIGLIVRKLPDE